MADNAQRLTETLRKFKKIGLDTQPFIYHFQANRKYVELTRAIFEAVEAGAVTASTSTITLLEILVKPIRDNDTTASQEYLFVLKTFPNLKLKPVDDGVAQRAAEITAKYNLRPPNAIQLASCLEEGAQAFFTNDRRLKVVREVEVHLLRDYTH